jgi:hypothetical protein
VLDGLAAFEPEQAVNSKAKNNERHNVTIILRSVLGSWLRIRNPSSMITGNLAEGIIYLSGGLFN